MFDRGLRGKIAVVTGAARGIGKACALALGEEGVHVALLDVDEAASDAAAGVINNAGKGRAPVPLEELTDDVWNQVVALNLTGSMLCARAVIAGMKRNGWGRIVNISSIAAHGRAESANISYAAAKAGILGFTRQLAMEVGSYGVTVNAVATGGILSGRVIDRWAAKTETEKKMTTDAIPLRRIGEPWEIARTDALEFLARRFPRTE